MSGAGATSAVDMVRLNMVSSIIDRTIEFIDQVYIPDLIAIAGFYKDWAAIGGGMSSKYLMSYGDLPIKANDYSPGNLMMPRGAIVDGNLNEIQDIDLDALDQVQEFVTHSWYKYEDEQQGLHPYQGETVPNFDIGGAKGTKTRIEAVDESAKYSWVKSPRWKGHAMEVGPLARYVIGYLKGIPEFKEPTDMVLAKLGGVPVTALFSTLGRTAARGLECSWAAHKLKDEFNKLVANIKAGDTATANMDNFEPSTWAKSARGHGFVEAPRGALCHWIDIEDQKIKNYQCVVPTTWNASPRDPAGKIGAYEAALLDTPMHDPELPLEILRTIHSFDPCLACATHVLDMEGNEVTSVKVR
jgi:hydrogenase large subunit